MTASDEAKKTLAGFGYLIWKRGAFYRPNAQGYTTSAIQAGRYSLADAISITHPNGPDGPRDGMGYVHESEVVDADWQAYSALLAEIATKDAALTAAMDALNELARHPEEDEGHSMPGDFRDYYRDVCNFAKQKVEEISAMKGVCNDRK